MKKFLFCSFKAPAAAVPVSTEAAPTKEEKKKEEPEEESDDDMGFGNLSNLYYLNLKKVIKHSQFIIIFYFE